MNLTTVLTAVSTMIVAGIVARFGLVENTQQTRNENVVAHVGANAAPAERDIVAELLGARVMVDRPATDYRANQFIATAVTEEEVATAKRLWQDRLDQAVTGNATAKANASRSTVRGAAPRPELKRSAYRPNSSRTDSRLTIYQRSKKIKSMLDKRTYGLPHRKRTTKRIRSTR